VEWPFVGRGREIAKVLAAAPSSGVLIEGPAGIGKSALAEVVATRLIARGAAVHRVVATTSAPAMAFGPFAHLIPGGDRTEDPGGLMRAIAAALRADGDHVALWVDDVHNLDDLSAALVQHLTVSTPVFVLMTLRGGEPVPAAIESIRKEGLAVCVTLPALGPEESREVLEGALGGPVDTALLTDLTRLTAGNPLLLREIVENAATHGAITREWGMWRAVSPLVASGHLPDVVRDHLERLSPDLRHAAEIIALGEPLSLPIAEAIVDEPALVELEDNHLIAVDTDGGDQIRFTHPLYGEVLRAALPPLRARRLRRTLAEALSAAGATSDRDVIRLALWRLDSGPADPGLFLDAARRAQTIFDHRLVHQLAAAAAATGGGFDAELLAASSLRWLGRAAQADTELLALAARAADEQHRVRAMVTWARCHALALGDPAGARGRLAELAATTHDPSLSEQLALALAATALIQGDAAASVALFEPFLGELSELASRFAPSMVWALCQTGRAEDAIELAERARPSAAAQPWPSGGMARALASARSFSGRDARRALAELRDAYQAALDAGGRGLQGQIAMVLGELELHHGSPQTARRMWREAAALLTADITGAGDLVHALDGLGELSAIAGDLDESIQALARRDALVKKHGLIAVRRRGHLWLCAAQGRLDDARRIGLHELDDLAHPGLHQERVLVAYTLVRLGFAAEVVDLLAEMETRVQGSAVHTISAWAQASAHGDATALEAAAVRLIADEVDGLAAECLAEASTLHHRAGRASQARAAAARARALLREDGGGRGPALTVLADHAPLTAREREIAKLAAAGLTNRQIAERLVISERTVHSHLHHTYTKLGVNDRQHLRDFLASPQ
jgi:DNA-binding NarL/FixJ family response regulator